jgi:hypothetical protein
MVSLLSIDVTDRTNIYLVHFINSSLSHSSAGYTFVIVHPRVNDWTSSPRSQLQTKRTNKNQIDEANRNNKQHRKSQSLVLPPVPPVAYRYKESAERSQQKQQHKPNQKLSYSRSTDIRYRYRISSRRESPIGSIFDNVVIEHGGTTMSCMLH